MVESAMVALMAGPGADVASQEQQPPFGAKLGVRLAAVEHGYAVFVATLDDTLYNPISMVHGDFVALMLDPSVCGIAVHSALKPGGSSRESHLHFVSLTARGSACERLSFAGRLSRR